LVNSHNGKWSGGGKRLNYFVANLFRIPHIKFYQNRPSFVEDMTKTFWFTNLLDTVYL